MLSISHQVDDHSALNSLALPFSLHVLYVEPKK